MAVASCVEGVDQEILVHKSRLGKDTTKLFVFREGTLDLGFVLVSYSVTNLLDLFETGENTVVASVSDGISDGNDNWLDAFDDGSGFTSWRY